MNETTKKSDNELASSDLGTLEYWEKIYSLEINNFIDHGDVGEVWFGNDSCDKIVRFIETVLKLPKDTAQIIDLGCGNGMFLIKLAEAGFKNLTGVDYSTKAIDLAKRVLLDNGYPKIELFVNDVLNFTNDSIFNLAHDKGTYDAISLHPENSEKKRIDYIINVHKLLKDEGFLVVTSCNWTKNELIDHFKDYFQIINEIPQKTFLFGGQTGKTITQIIFLKNSKK